MNKKIISILLITSLGCSTLIACGNSTKGTTSSSTDVSETNQNTDSEVSAPTSPKEEASSDTPSFTDAKATAEVNKVISISDIKGKGENAIKALLGEPSNISNDTYTYSKGGYTFEITYFNAVCGKVKITPEAEMAYPGDGINILKVLDINANEADLTTPQGMTWNNKFDTYQIDVTCDNTVYSKLGNINIILEGQYK